MTEQIRLYSQDYTQILYTGEDWAAAEQYLKDSGTDWLPIVIDYGGIYKYRQRWSGRIGMLDDGGTEVVGAREFLNYIIQTSNPTIE